jgi:hypothetical protein
MNREQRRQAAQLQRAKPAPRRRDRVAAINTMDMVRNKVGRLTEAEVAFIMRPAEAGFEALRRGVASLVNWQNLAQLVTMAVAIEASGIVTGLAVQFAAAREALQAVHARVTSDPQRPTWGSSTTMHAEELIALREALQLHRFQLQQLSAGELQRLYRVLVRTEAQ